VLGLEKQALIRKRTQKAKAQAIKVKYLAQNLENRIDRQRRI
jgi:hypothetical protein